MTTPERMFRTLLAEMPALGWQVRAACASASEPDIFYPEITSPRPLQRHVNKVRTQYCAGCPVKAECLTTGWEDPHGIWAGTTGPQRERARYLVRQGA